MPRSLSGLEVSANRFPHSSCLSAPKEAQERLPRRRLITAFFRRGGQTPRRQWQFHTAINWPTSGSPQLETRGQSFSHLTVISGFSFVLQCYLRGQDAVVALPRRAINPAVAGGVGRLDLLLFFAALPFCACNTDPPISCPVNSVRLEDTRL